MTDDPQARRWWEDERKVLAALVAGAFVARLLAALGTFVIHKDGARFTLMARYFSEGRWDEGLDVWPRMAPLFPMLILVFREGAAVAMTLGALSVLPIYFLARSIWDRRVATLSGLVAAFLPDSIRLGGECMSEAPFMLFFFTAMFFVHRAAEKAALRDFVPAGLSGGLATLTRPEGIYVLGAVVVWTAVRGIREGKWPARALGVLVALLLFAAIVSPYSRWVHLKTGRWDVSDSPVIAALKHRLKLSRDNIVVPAAEGQTARQNIRQRSALADYALTWLKVSGYALMPALLLGFFELRRNWNHAFIVVVGVGYSIPPLLNDLTGIWFSDRFLVPAMVWWAPVVALGLLALGRRLSRWVPEAKRRRAGIAALSLVFAVMVARELRPNGLDRRTIIDAGRWIREHAPRHPTLVSMDRRVDHYADAFSETAEFRFEPMSEQVRRLKAGWVVILMDRIRYAEPGYLDQIERDYERAQVVPKSDRGEEIRIYRVR